MRSGPLRDTSLVFQFWFLASPDWEAAKPELEPGWRGQGAEKQSPPRAAPPGNAAACVFFPSPGGRAGLRTNRLRDTQVGGRQTAAWPGAQTEAGLDESYRECGHPPVRGSSGRLGAPGTMGPPPGA